MSQGSLQTSSPARSSSEVGSLPFRLGRLRHGGPLPLVVSPARGAQREAGRLASVLADAQPIVRGWLRDHGAVLFRGFDVKRAQDLEDVALAIEPALSRTYLGTSPRKALTRHVFTASELPPHYPIPQHIEMSFLPSAPRLLFFGALHANRSPGGETPLTDFRAVLRDLDPDVRARFEERGVRNVRAYAGPERRSRLDPWALKRWDEMFDTTDRSEVERRAAAEGLTAEWKPGDVLQLVNVQPATRIHAESGAPTWFNHVQVFHPSAAAAELRHAARRQRSLRSLALSALAAGLVRARRRIGGEDALPMNVTYGDGSPIPDADADAVRDAIWKNTVVERWRDGDVVVIDNTAIAHGRLPYRGERLVAVAWA